MKFTNSYYKKFEQEKQTGGKSVEIFLLPKYL
jgi:hypothetical protein